MTDSELLVALLAGVLAVAVGVVGNWTRERPLPARAGAPSVGRSAAAVAAGPEPAFLDVLVDPAGVVPPVTADRLRAVLATGSPPPAADAICLHLFPGDAPASELEEGPPWHLLLDRDGKLSATSRWSAGRPAAAPGSRPSDALRGLHVVVPDAELTGPGRLAAWRALRRELLALLPSAAVRVTAVRGVEAGVSDAAVQRWSGTEHR